MFYFCIKIFNLLCLIAYYLKDHNTKENMSPMLKCIK